MHNFLNNRWSKALMALSVLAVTFAAIPSDARADWRDNRRINASVRAHQINAWKHNRFNNHGRAPFWSNARHNRWYDNRRFANRWDNRWDRRNDRRWDRRDWDRRW